MKAPFPTYAVTLGLAVTFELFDPSVKTAPPEPFAFADERPSPGGVAVSDSDAPPGPVIFCVPTTVSELIWMRSSLVLAIDPRSIPCVPIWCSPVPPVTVVGVSVIRGPLVFSASACVVASLNVLAVPS